MPKKAAQLLHVAKVWRVYAKRSKDGAQTLVHKEEYAFVEVEDVDVHCKGAWHAQEHRYWAGIASSGRAECRKCGEKIDKGTIRIGLPRKQSSGIAGYITSWHHLECCRAEGGPTEPELTALTYWAEGVDAEKRKTVLSTLTATTVPKCSEAVDPTDDSFMGLEATASELQHATPPAGLCGKLLPFQSKGLWWMLKQEAGEYTGGILADDMGLGKTIQTISLLLAAKEAAAAKAKAAESSASSAAAAPVVRNSPTLVIVRKKALQHKQSTSSRCV
jgi:DNA repair protein RAD16